MGRRGLLAAAAVPLATALLVAGHPHGGWPVAGYAAAIGLIVVLAFRGPVAAFVAALALAALNSAAYVLLLWVGHRTGRRLSSRRDMAVVGGAALGGLGVQLATATPRSIPNTVCVYAVFVALPLLVGRYLAQHRRLVSELDQRNRRLRRERELLGEQERLRERLRIARDMHDSLGHRLSLVSIQAAALEVTLPEAQRTDVRRLAEATRGALDELHDLVGTLRREPEPDERRPGPEAIEALVAGFRSAGIAVTLLRHGEPAPLPEAAAHTAYRVVEEGLTNAAKHAPGRLVTVSVGWEPDALLITLENPLTAPADDDAGHGLAGLGERARAAGGFLDHRAADGSFRLVAMLPVEPPDEVDDERPLGGVRMAALGFVTAAVMFVIVPAAMLLGVA